MQFRKPFYYPEGNGSGNGSDVNTRVSFKFQDAEEEFDWANPDDVSKLKQIYAKGKLYDKKMHDLSKEEELIKMAKEWDKLILAAKASDDGREELVDRLGAIGVELTPKQERQLDNDLDFDTENKIIGELKKQIGNLSKELKDIKLSNTASQIDDTHRALAAKYNGKDGLPKYDPEAVERYVRDKNLYAGDLREQYEFAYELMNREAILKHERDAVTEESIARKSKRDRARTESGEETLNLGKKEIYQRGDSYDTLLQKVAQQYNEEDFLTDE